MKAYIHTVWNKAARCIYDFGLISVSDLSASSTPAEHAPVSTSFAPVCPPTIAASPNELLLEPQIANQAPEAEQIPEQHSVNRCPFPCFAVSAWIWVMMRLLFSLLCDCWFSLICISGFIQYCFYLKLNWSQVITTMWTFSSYNYFTNFCENRWLLDPVCEFQANVL